MADFNAIQKLDLNLLKVFESIYQEQNMTRTAEALYITPSAVSHALKRLRECLGDPLFLRSHNRMLPSPACQRMAPLIIDNLSRLRQILQHWGEFHPITSSHHFTLGIHYAVEPSILPKLVKKLSDLAPNATFSSVKVVRENLTRALTAGHIDMAFDVALPLKPPIMHKKLIDDSFCVLVRNGHPLANSMSKEAYFAAKHISVSNRPSGATVEDILFQQKGMSRHINIRCQNYYAAKTMMVESDLLLTVPNLLAKQLVETEQGTRSFEEVTMPFPLVSLETHLYWHQNTEQDEALSWFRHILQHMVT